MTELGPDWVPDDDGVPHRNAARVVLFDSVGRVFLLNGHDGHDIDHQWWFTVGGGLEPGEAPREAAVREVFEETGLKLDPGDLIGPVLDRSAEFHFFNVMARQDELFFIARLDSEAPVLAPAQPTAMEETVLDGNAWFFPAEIGTLSERAHVFPRQLASMTANWWSGWDGICVELTETGG